MLAASAPPPQRFPFRGRAAAATAAPRRAAGEAPAAAALAEGGVRGGGVRGERLRGKAGGHTPTHTHCTAPRDACAAGLLLPPLSRRSRGSQPITVLSAQPELRQRPIRGGSGRGGGVRATARRARGGAVARGGRALRGLGAAPGPSAGYPILAARSGSKGLLWDHTRPVHSGSVLPTPAGVARCCL